MSQTLKIKNFSELNVVEPTSLLDNVAAGATTIPVQNNQGFVANGYFIVGRLGSETTEVLTVASTIGATTIVSSTATVRTHSIHEQVHLLYGDKIRVYRAANVDGSPPADVAYSQIAEINIDYDQASTSYTDPNGSNLYWYKSTYYNSTLDVETALVSSSALRGGSYGNYATLSSIRQAAGLQNNSNITDALIEEKRQTAQSIINSALSGRYTVPFTSPIPQLVAEMTRLLAAGYLLTQELGGNSSNSGVFYSEGLAMIERVTNADKTGLLDRLDAGSLTLVDAVGTSQALSGGGNFKGWPNKDTAAASAENGGGERKFRVSDRY